MMHLNNIGEQLLSGVMFHLEMADLFQFLGLNGFYKWQIAQSQEELCNLQKFKHYVLKTHHKLINLQQSNSPEKLIPDEWYNRSSLEVTQTDITNTLKRTLDEYIKWEEQAKKNLLNELNELEQICDKQEIKKVIKDVDYELTSVEELRQKLQVTSFSPIFIQLLQEKYK